MTFSFWEILGAFTLLISICLAFFVGFYKINWFWIIAILPSYLIGFYLYQSRYLKTVYNKGDRSFKLDLPRFLTAGFVILFIFYLIGYLINFFIN